MRLLRATLFVLPILLGAALLALWLVPPRLDWGRYRSTIAQLAGARLGLPVTIQGPVTLSLLPEPVLTAGQVSVGNPAADGVLIRVKALRLRVALIPLLAGRVDARELVLRGPDLHIPWPAQPDTLTRPPAWLSAFDARVENGRLSVGQFAVTGVEGRLSSLSTGTLTAAVTASIAGQRWRVVSRLTAAGADGTAGLTVSLAGRGKASGTTARFSGQFSPQGQLVGSVTASGPNLSVLLPSPALPFSADGRLTVADGLAVADELQVKLGGAPATGAVALRMQPHPRLDIALRATRLHLDPWTPLLLAQPAATQVLPVGLDFSAQAATLAGATLHHLRATFELAPGVVTVREAAATLPGDADMNFAGRIIRTDAAGPSIEGSGRLHTPVLRTTLHWLLPHAARVLAVLPPAAARNADLTGQILLQPGRVVLRKLHGELDDSAVSGSLDWKAGKPPAIAADLLLGKLRLDSWVAAAGLQRAITQQFDTDLRLSVQHASFDGMAIRDLRLDAASLGGAITLRRLQGSALDAHLAVQGKLKNDRLRDASLVLTTDNAERLASLLPTTWRASPALWQGPARLKITAAGPLPAVAASVTLNLGDLRLRAQPTINLQAGTSTGPLTVQYPNAVRLVSELDLPPQSGLDGMPDWLGQGSLSLVSQVNLAPGPRLHLANAQLVAGRLRTGLDLTLDLGGKDPTLRGTLTADTLPLPVPGDGTLPVALLGGWQGRLQLTARQILASGAPVLSDAGATLTVGQGRLRLDHVTGRLGGGTLAGSASLDAARTPPLLSVRATLAKASIDAPLTGLPLDVVSGRTGVSLSLKAQGYSPQALLASLSGTVQATVQDGSLSGFDLAGLRTVLRTPGKDVDTATLKSALSGGHTAFQQLTLKGQITHGIMSLDQAALTSQAGTAQAAGSVALPDATADLRIVLRPAVASPPDIPLQLNGALAKPRRIPELAALLRWRTAHKPPPALHKPPPAQH